MSPVKAIFYVVCYYGDRVGRCLQHRNGTHPTWQERAVCIAIRYGDHPDSHRTVQVFRSMTPVTAKPSASWSCLTALPTAA